MIGRQNLKKREWFAREKRLFNSGFYYLKMAKWQLFAPVLDNLQLRYELNSHTKPKHKLRIEWEYVIIYQRICGFYLSNVILTVKLLRKSA